MVNKKSKLIMRVLPMLIASAYAGVALAEDKVEEVVVTAQKRKEKLSEVPISISAISGAQLETRGIEGRQPECACAEPDVQAESRQRTDLHRGTAGQRDRSAGDLG